METKALNNILSQQKKRKSHTTVNLGQAKKRIANLQQLQDSVTKQMSYMKMKTEKITDVYLMNKILMMLMIFKI